VLAGIGFLEIYFKRMREVFKNIEQIHFKNFETYSRVMHETH